MTPEAIKAWRRRLGLSQVRAAAALGGSDRAALAWRKATHRSTGGPNSPPTTSKNTRRNCGRNDVAGILHRADLTALERDPQRLREPDVICSVGWTDQAWPEVRTRSI
ncbi:hypothetical protein STHU_26070 [Allostella humosa]|nr:hypothetical protein STHU_26070 [Stella humosa]